MEDDPLLSAAEYAFKCHVDFSFSLETGNPILTTYDDTYDPVLVIDWSLKSLEGQIEAGKYEPGDYFVYSIDPPC